MAVWAAQPRTMYVSDRFAAVVARARQYKPKSSDSDSETVKWLSNGRAVISFQSSRRISVVSLGSVRCFRNLTLIF